MMKDSTSVTFIGTRKGEMTPVAIRREPVGSEVTMGAAMKS